MNDTNFKVSIVIFNLSNALGTESVICFLKDHILQTIKQIHK